MKQVNKIFFPIFIILLFILSTTLIPTTEARNYIFTTESTLELTPNEDDFGLVNPDGTKVSTEITITYTYDKFSRPTLWFLKNRRNQTQITLAIKSKPDWCTIDLDETNFDALIETPLRGNTINLTTTLTASIEKDKNAIGLEKGKIILNATAKENGNIKASEATCEISITPTFTPEISVRMSNNSVNLTTGEETNITIIIKNKSNTKIIAEINSDLLKTDNYESFFNKTEEIIDIDEEKQFLLTIITYDSENYTKISFTMPLNITYHSKTDSSYKGDPISINFEINIENEKKQTPGFEIITTIIALAITIIILKRKK